MAGRRVVSSSDGGRMRLRETKSGPQPTKGRQRSTGAGRDPQGLIMYVVDAEGKREASLAPVRDATLKGPDAVFALLRTYVQRLSITVCFRRACVNCASPEPTVFLIEGTHGLGGPMTIDTPLHAEHQLDQLAGQFAHWRQTRPRPFAPIPSALWDQAVALAAALPPARVAHHIRVRVADLTKQMVARQVAPLAGPAPTSLGFVEVPPAPARPQATPTMQLELSRADGTRLSIHGAASTVPLETVLRAFLEGR